MRLIWYPLCVLVIVFGLAYPFINPPAPLPEEEVVALPEEPLPVPAPQELSIDFSSFASVAQKKRAFVAFLRPAVEKVNQELAAKRVRLKTLLNAERLSDKDSVWLNEMAQTYKVKAKTKSQKLQALLRRVDQLPESLVMMQAANESAWGTSRFARKGFNFFGQWCFRKGCGLIPNERDQGLSHEVARFSDVEASVRAYFFNINTNPAYDLLRELRYVQRRENEPLNGELLASGLSHYSSRGEAYVLEISDMIRFNQSYLK